MVRGADWRRRGDKLTASGIHVVCGQVRVRAEAEQPKHPTVVEAGAGLFACRAPPMVERAEVRDREGDNGRIRPTAYWRVQILSNDPVALLYCFPLTPRGSKGAGNTMTNDRRGPL